MTIKMIITINKLKRNSSLNNERQRKEVYDSGMKRINLQTWYK